MSSLSQAGSGVGGGVMMEATRKNGKDGDEPRRRGWGGSTCAFPCRLTGASIASRGRTCTTPRGGGGGTEGGGDAGFVRRRR